MPVPAVVVGGSCICTGAFPPGSCTFASSSQTSCLAEGKPCLTIQDVSPAVIPTFGMCFSPTNPAVQAATAAALGVPTPAPCTFAPVGTWSCGNSTIIAGGLPVLGMDGTLTCGVGQGQIKIVNAGQSKMMV